MEVQRSVNSKYLITLCELGLGLKGRDREASLLHVLLNLLALACHLFIPLPFFPLCVFDEVIQRGFALVLALRRGAL